MVDVVTKLIEIANYGVTAATEAETKGLVWIFVLIPAILLFAAIVGAIIFGIVVLIGGIVALFKEGPSESHKWPGESGGCG